jgi:hypothetical protein
MSTRFSFTLDRVLAIEYIARMDSPIKIDGKFAV